MPRSNRPRGSRGDGSSRGSDDEAFDLSKVFYGRSRTETKRDGLWNVQSLAASAASKHYLCPGCGLGIPRGAAHIVAWRADGLMGEADDIAARRHWHSHCWKIK